MRRTNQRSSSSSSSSELNDVLSEVEFMYPNGYDFRIRLRLQDWAREGYDFTTKKKSESLVERIRKLASDQPAVLNEKVKRCKVPQVSEEKGFGRSSRHDEEFGKRYFSGPDNLLIVSVLEYGFASATLAIAFLKVVRPVLLELIKLRGEGSTTIICPGIRIEVKGGADLDKAIEGTAKLIQKEREPDAKATQKPEKKTKPKPSKSKSATSKQKKEAPKSRKRTPKKPS